MRSQSLNISDMAFFHADTLPRRKLPPKRTGMCIVVRAGGGGLLMHYARGGKFDNPEGLFFL